MLDPSWSFIDIVCNLGNNILLLNILGNFQVLRVVKTRQVTYSVLNHLIDYVQNLEKIGLLEEKEMLHLHDAVQVSFSDFLLFTLSTLFRLRITIFFLYYSY